MGNSNSIDEKICSELIKPIKEIFEKSNIDVKDGLIKLFQKRVQPLEWSDGEKNYLYSKKDDLENIMESFKITFYPNGTCSTQEIKHQGKDDYKEDFSFGIFSPSVNGIDVETITLEHTKGWSYTNETCKGSDSKQYYFARRKIVDELISYSELIKCRETGPYVLLPTD